MEANVDVGTGYQVVNAFRGTWKFSESRWSFDFYADTVWYKGRPVY